jgi:hypothetical protein
MEPLSPQDPLWSLLGKAKAPVTRPDFVSKVLREARQTSQHQSVLRMFCAALLPWFSWPRLALPVTAALLLVGWAGPWLSQPSFPGETLAAEQFLQEVVDPWSHLDQAEALEIASAEVLDVAEIEAFWLMPGSVH